MSNELPENLKKLQVGQKIYLKSIDCTATATVSRVNKNTITLNGALKLVRNIETNKLNHKGIVRGTNEFHDLHICTKEEYNEQKKAYSIIKNFNNNFRFMPQNLSLIAKEKMLSILHQDRAGAFK